MKIPKHEASAQKGFRKQCVLLWRCARVKLGLTQKEVGAMLGLEQSAVCLVEHCIQRINADHLAFLCARAGLSLDLLLREESELIELLERLLTERYPRPVATLTTLNTPEERDANVRLGAQIRTRRLELRLTQLSVANWLGWTQRRLSRLERGEIRLPHGLRAGLCEILKMPSSWLADDNQDRSHLAQQEVTLWSA